MERLVFKYTHCDCPECWEWNVPFEYESKEKFIFDVLDNPKVLDKLGIVNVWDWQIEEKTIFNEDYYRNVNKYVFTLEEWFQNSKTN